MKVTLTALVLALATTFASAQGNPPVKIVGSLDLSGPLAAMGADVLAGFQIAVDMVNKKGGVLGRQIVLEYQDNGTNPQRAVQQATALVQQGPALLLSPVSSGGTLAVTKAVSEKFKMPMCAAVSAAEEVTMKSFQRYIFSVPGNTYQWMKGTTARLAKQPYKRYAILVPDYVAGRTSANRFKEFLKEANPQAQIVVEEYPKLGATDYTANINKILAAKPDYVWSLMFGTDLLTFFKQASAVGFFQQVNNHFTAPMVTNELKIAGDGAPIGIDGYQYAPFNYLMAQSSDVRDFVGQYKAKTGEYPPDVSLAAADCITTWVQAVAAAKSFEAEAVIRAIESTEFNTTRGTLRFRKLDHLLEVPLYFGKVTRSKEFGQPVLQIDEVVPASVSRAPDSVILEARKE